MHSLIYSSDGKYNPNETVTFFSALWKPAQRIAVALSQLSQALILSLEF